MKILSLNTHSLAEPDCGRKLEQFAAVVARELPDIIGLQEVNQTALAPALWPEEPEGFTVCRGMDGWNGEKKKDRNGDAAESFLRRDHYGAQLSKCLKKLGLSYDWTWIPVKLGYGKYDEGLALFSRYPILDTHQCLISRSREYQNWKTRKLLGILTQIPGRQPAWFYTVHMGWWDDEEEPFQEQWDRLQDALAERLEPGKPPVWLMGDFNSRDDVRGQGYDYVKSRGWKDTYVLAEKKDSGKTVEAAIDGWKERKDAGGREDGEGSIPGMRIDYIWCSQEEKIRESKVICNGREYPVVSDHSGVLVTAKDPEPASAEKMSKNPSGEQKK